VGVSIQRFEALDNRAAVYAGQRAQRADSCARNRAVDDPGEVVASQAKVADHLPDGVSRCVNRNHSGDMGHLVALHEREEHV